MFEIDIIFCIYRLHACFVPIDCRKRVVKYKFSNEPILEQNGGNSMQSVQIISSLMTCRIIAKGCLYNVVRFTHIECENPSIE